MIDIESGKEYTPRKERIMAIEGIDPYSTYVPPQTPTVETVPPREPEPEQVTEENVGQNVNTSA
jgi:hypothetical protein